MDTLKALVSLFNRPHGMNSIENCEDAAYLIFSEIKTRHGLAEARRIFRLWGPDPSPRRVAQVGNLGLLDRLDMMKPGPNVQRLARELAVENKALPRAKQRGAGGTDPMRLERQIRRQVLLRKQRISKGTWTGPFPDHEP